MSTPPSPPSGDAHRHRDVAESFGSDAARYDRTRPRYPDGLIARIVAAVPGPDILDVGCGTGIEARQFQASGCRVLGVEPDERMAAFARGTGVDVEMSRFEAWDQGGRTFDGVVSGQAWHWVDPVAGAAKAATVLRRGGRLAVFWHAFDLPDEVASALATVFTRVVPDAPFQVQAMSQGIVAYQGLFDRAADGLRATGAFLEPEQWRFDWSRAYTREEWLDQLPTSGALTRLPAPQLAQILDGVGTAIDELGGAFTLRYATIAVTAAVA
jgi:SAM-dependent methyltransferase